VRIRALDEDAEVDAEVERLERGLRCVRGQTAGDRVSLAARVRETVQMPWDLALRGSHQGEGAGEDAREYSSAHVSPPSSRIRSDAADLWTRRRYARFGPASSRPLPSTTGG
jgi:hypothetical protein